MGRNRTLSPKFGMISRQQAREFPTIRGPFWDSLKDGSWYIEAYTRVPDLEAPTSEAKAGRVERKSLWNWRAAHPLPAWAQA